MEELDRGRGGWIVTPNLDILRQIVVDPDVHQLIAQASFRVADGMPLIWASRLQGTPLPERVAGSSLISTLSGGAAAQGRSVFLLGGDEGTAKGAAEELRKKFPNLVIAGTYYPEIGFDRDDHEMQRIGNEMIKSKPDIVYVALGCPKQERVISRLKPLVPNTWWVGVGISFSFLCGQINRAPKWMQKLGIEWIHRLWQEPGRLFRRYVIHDIPFAFKLLYKSMIDRFYSSR
jgi:N-acetylglucosaminyldiphosphoundecaprenol N-acetyl-beta-D-mannosaminyltransferase